VERNGVLWLQTNSECRNMMVERSGHLELAAGHEECTKEDAGASPRPRARAVKFELTLGQDGVARVTSEAVLSMVLEGKLKEGKMSLAGTAKRLAESAPSASTRQQ
jgi:hypothetical protein